MWKCFLIRGWVWLRAEPKGKISGSSGNRTTNPRSSSTYHSPYNDYDSLVPNHGPYWLNIDLFYVNRLFDHIRNELTTQQLQITPTVGKPTKILQKLAAACKSNGTHQTTKTNISVHPPGKTLKTETSKEMAGDCNRPRGQLLERIMILLLITIMIMIMIIILHTR
jgi:hypothetical protein